MIHPMKPNYKGIVIFGAPGSGKTTVARHLVSEFPKAKHIEAAHCVIYPAMAFRDKLPKDEKKFLHLLTEQYGKHSGKNIVREDARAFSTYLKNKYSHAVIAKTLIRICEKKLSKKFIIIAGTRGYKNAVHFKKHGYLLVYLKTPEKHSSRRLAKRESFSVQKAEKEWEIEKRIFSTNKVEKIAHLSFNTAVIGKKEMSFEIQALVAPRECARCVNSSVNPSCVIGKSGMCDVCEGYMKNFSSTPLRKELKFLFSLRRSGTGKYDALVGISGGKDSTATLYEIQKMGFTPLAFSLDAGYYPKHIFPRARRVAADLGVPYEKIDARKYIRPADRMSFRKTAALYAEKESEVLREKFRKWYMEDRRHYSVKCTHAIPFVRTCQLCRRMIVRAYYGEAMRHGVRLVILGINEWAGLSQDSTSKKIVFSAIRKLQPFKNRPAVHVVHLPFLLQRTVKDTEKILKKLEWKIPRGESLIESNSNSCLFARAAENKARRMLGFHPDATRLAREVTVGFITKKQAYEALNKIHSFPHSVETILKKAGVL